MLILKKLYEKIAEDNAFTEHAPTHPEYPDFVKDFCYRLKSVSTSGMFTSYIAVSFVLPKNVKNEELGFNFNLVSSAGMKGGSQLSFLTKADAENFAKKYVSEAVTPYISGHSIELVRLDSHSDIPCYVESSFSPRINSISGSGRPPRMSPNLFARMSKNPITYQKNPFSSQDADLNAKSTKLLKNIDKIIPQIEKNLESLKKVCSNIDLLVDYKEANTSVIDATIARGETDKKFKDLLNSAWHYGKGDVLSIEIRTNKTEAYFCVPDSSSIFTFNLDLLPNNTKDMFSEELFIEILANTLAKIYKYKHRFGYGEYQHQHQVVNPSGYWQTFAIQENLIEFNLRGLKFDYYQFENIENLINEINEAAINIKKAINIAADFLPKAIFTVDDFDSEEEE